MIETNTCPECGVPIYITGEHLWLDNGDIVQSRDEGHRITFTESENIDSLFSNIESIIGFPIDDLVTTSVHKAVRSYVSLLVPEEVKRLCHNKMLDPIPIARAMMDVSAMMGQGRQEYVDHSYENSSDDFYTVKVHEPFSMPMMCGIISGAVEAVLGEERGVTHKRLSEESIEITVFPAPHAAGLKERLKGQRYHHHSGGIKLQRCATCGGPLALCDYQWHLDREVINSKSKGRRMVMMGPQELDLVFKELEAELGDTIPKVVVEAQRRFAANGFYSLWDAKDADDFGGLLALGGTG
jgi:hypothetical protein